MKRNSTMVLQLRLANRLRGRFMFLLLASWKANRLVPEPGLSDI